MELDKEILTKLYKYCAYQDRCRSEIEQKMIEIELDSDFWEYYMVHLAKERFWDEERYVKSITRGKFFHKGWGKHKIRNALRQKRISDALIDKAFAAEIPDDVYEETITKLSERKLKELKGTTDIVKRQKLTRFLQQRGFEWDIVQRRITLLLSTLCLLSLFLLRCTRTPESEYASHQSDTYYVGKETCRSCHENTYNSYMKTGMGHSMYLPDQAQQIERFGPEEVVFDERKNFYYQAYWEDSQMYIREFRKAGQDTIYERREAVSYIVGSGHQTRSYLMERNDYWYEMPITWYVEKQIWDLSPGYEVNNSRFEREIGQECMSCHTGHNEYVAGSKNKFKKVSLGIGCEKCHGPGSAHVQKARNGNMGEDGIDYSIVNPNNLAIQEQFDVCQQCHLQGVNVYRQGKSIADFRPGQALTEVMDIFIEAQQDKGAFGIASHAERLQSSPCFMESAGKLNCTTCHNPHKSISVTDPKRYIRSCNNCHTPEKVNLCSASAELQMTKAGDCVSCHMPQGGTRDIPHVSFHDHKIRVVRESDSVDVEAVKDFLRLQLATQKSVPDSVWGQAWLLYYERHEANPTYLETAARQLSQGPSYPQAQIAFLQNDLETAKSALKNAEAADPFVQFLWGKILSAEGLHLKSHQAYTKAYKLQPASIEAGLKVATSLLRARQGDRSVLPEAAQKLEALKTEKPFDVRILTNLAFVYLNSGRVREAKNLLEEALRYDPDYAPALDNLKLINR
ncbi:MAG: RecX family transcriptional regulator [Bacteroidia bacterium]